MKIRLCTSTAASMATCLLPLVLGCQGAIEEPDGDSGLCGNGVVDASEGCDDGNGNVDDACPDGPTGSCQVAECGDGYVQKGVEGCDDGPLNSDTMADVCRTDCTVSFCGDGVVDTLEACDDGNGVLTDACPDGAQGTCELPACGDGFLYSEAGDAFEECDAGSENSDSQADACRTNCRVAYCGDGTTDAGELCDDGNGSLTDACPDGDAGTCEIAYCGDGFARTDVTAPAGVGYEGCDDGARNSDVNSGACRHDCQVPRCGDYVVDDNEECDDGANNSDTVSNACRVGCVLPGCGDGVIDDEDACDLRVVQRNRYPVRLSEGPDGVIFVTDAKAGSVFIYDTHLTLTGELKGLINPLGVVLSPSHLVYVGLNDPDNNADRVDVFSLAGEHVATIGEGSLLMPTDLDLDADGNLYVVDSLLRTVKVFGPDGQWLRDIGTPDNGNGIPEDDELLFPIAISVGYRSGHDSGEVFVADQGHFRVAVFGMQGNVRRTMGSRRELISDHQGKFAKLQSIAIDSHGRLHAADSQMAVVQILNADTGAYIDEYGELGTLPLQLNLPLDIFITANNRVIVANNQNHRIEVIHTVP